MITELLEDIKVF